MSQQNNTLVWFLLVDSKGQPFKGTPVSSLSPTSLSIVDQFRDAVHLKNSSAFIGINSSQLTVYANMLAFQGKESPLEGDSVLSGLGASEKEAIIVVVPLSTSSPSTWVGHKQRTAVYPENAMRQPLFEREATAFMQHPPICSVTFFQGDIATAKQFLETRLATVLALNPWLGGTLARVGRKVELVYPAESIPLNGLFSVLTEPVKNLEMTTEYEVLMKACIPLSIGGNGLANGAKQLKSKSVISRVVIAPTTKSGTPGFALVFSLSHAVADGYTYYEILGMLSDNPLADVRAMNPARKQEYEAEHLSRLISPKVLKFGASLTFMKAYLAGMIRKPLARPLAYFVDQERVNQTKAAHSSDTFISTNDIITSHLMTVCSPRLGMMAINYRPRCPILDSNDAGNYEEIVLSDLEGYKTPDAVRASLVADADGAYVGIKKQLPGFWGKCSLAFISSWAMKGTSPPFDLSLGEKAQQLLHLPILFLPMPLARCPMDTAIVFRPLPNKLALLVFAKTANSQTLLAGNHPFGACVNPDMFSET